jgi:hypothetical protein
MLTEEEQLVSPEKVSSIPVSVIFLPFLDPSALISLFLEVF